MRRAAGLVPLLVLLLTAPSAAALPVREAPDSAHVTWRVDPDRGSIEAAMVDVAGGADGDPVGLQLITADGNVPTEPLVRRVADGHAWFDLADHQLDVEAVTGVRVLLGRTAREGVLRILVDQRFFNRGGREQVGLRAMTLLRIERGDTYTPPAVPARYAPVSCRTVGLTAQADVVAEGTGTFSATTTGRHLVCYRLRELGPTQDDEESGVLGDATTVGEDVADAPATHADADLLPATGGQVPQLALVALVVTTIGVLLLRLRRRRPSDDG